MDRLQELVRLHRLKTRCHEVARLLGMSPNTERVYRTALQSAGLLEGDERSLPSLSALQQAVQEYRPAKPLPSQQRSSLEGMRERVAKLLGKGASAKSIYDLVRHEEDFEASYSALKRLCRSIQREKPMSASAVVVPLETAPGAEAQVDFGYAGRLKDPDTGEMRRTWFFVMTLSYSRHFFLKFVTDQTIDTWLQCHVEAFEFFGAVPHIIVPDNLKAAVIRAAFSMGDKPDVSRSYRSLAGHYGFKIDPTPPYQPQKKGKVERSVAYIKSNFLAPREFVDRDDAQRQADFWNENVASVRSHGTLHRRPIDLFLEDDQAAMLALTQPRYELRVFQKVTVNSDWHVHFRRRLYSVPYLLVGQELWLEATKESVYIYNTTHERVATHSRHGDKVRATHAAHSPPVRGELAERTLSHWFERADELAPQVGEYVREVEAGDPHVSMLSVIQAIVLLLERVGADRARAATTRARYFGNYRYQALKRMLALGLEQQPLPQQQSTHMSSLSEPPRFAREAQHYQAQRVQVA